LSADSIACQRSMIAEARRASETAAGTPIQEHRLICPTELGPPIPRIEPATVVHYTASPAPQHRVLATAAAPSAESVQAIAAAVAGMIRGQGLIGDVSSLTTPSRMPTQPSTSRPPAVPRCPSPPALRVPSRSPPSSSRLQLSPFREQRASTTMSPFRERRHTPTVQPPPNLRSTLPNMSTLQMAKQVYSPPTSFRQRRSLAVPSNVGTPSGSFVATTPAPSSVCGTCGASSVAPSMVPPAPVVETPAGAAPPRCSSTASSGSVTSAGSKPWAHGGGGQLRCQATGPLSPPQCHRQRSVSPARAAVQPIPLAAAAAAATARAGASSVIPQRQSPRPVSCRSVIRC